MNDLIPFTDIERMAKAIADSRLFGIANPTQALALMLVAQSEGRHPASAARDYHVIEGRPSLKADTMLARFQEAGGKVEWHTYTAEKAEATFSHPSGGSLRLSWTMDDAKRAGLGGSRTGRPTPWQAYPRAMLRARVISEAIRTLLPGVLCGFYTPEEVVDFKPSGGNEQPEKDMGQAEVIRAETKPTRQKAKPSPSTPDPSVQAGEQDQDYLTIANLRRALSAQFARLGFNQDDQKEWLSGNYPDPAAALRDKATIESMVEMLKKTPAVDNSKDAMSKINFPIDQPAQENNEDIPLANLRKALSAQFSRLGLNQDDQKEWLSENYPDPTAALSDEATIEGMIDMLKF